MLLKSTFLVLLQILLIHLRKCESVSLPRWVWRVKSCPHPTNITEWKEAGKRLNCFHDLTSKNPNEQGAVYHCLPSTYFNESVEFCGRSVPIAPGNCPVYNYRYAQNIAPSYYNCSDFTTGCPKVMFHSKEVYKFPMCLKIKSGCYEADVKCINKSTSIPTTTISFFQSIPTTTIPSTGTKHTDFPNKPKLNPITKYNSESSNILPIWIVLIVVAVIMPVSAIVVWKRKHLPCLSALKTTTRIISEEEMLELNDQRFFSTFAQKLAQKITSRPRRTEAIGDVEKNSARNGDHSIHTNERGKENGKDGDQEQLPLLDLNSRVPADTTSLSGEPRISGQDDESQPKLHTTENKAVANSAVPTGDTLKNACENNHQASVEIGKQNSNDVFAASIASPSLPDEVGQKMDFSSMFSTKSLHTTPVVMKDTSELHNGKPCAREDGTNMEEGKSIPKLDKCWKAAINWGYNELLNRLGKDMSPELMNCIKSQLREREENTDGDLGSSNKSASDDLKGITEPSDLLDYLNKKYIAFNNIVFLQGILLASKAPLLYDRCLQYAERRKDEIIYFEKRVLEKSHKKVIYTINCPNVSHYKRSELETLRKLVSTLIHASYDDVIVSCVKNGCVLVTFMIRKCLIPSLRSLYAPSKRNMTYQWMMSLPLQYKIVKVMIEDDVVYMPDQLMNVEGLKKEAKLSGSAQKLSYPLCHAEKDQVCIQTKDETVATIPKCEIENCIKDADKILKLEKNRKQTLELKNFLKELSGGITDDMLQSMKFLLHDFIEKEKVTMMSTDMILDHLSTTFQLQYNMCFLQWMFDKSNEIRLSKKCAHFESENRFELLCFHSNAISCKGRQHLKFHIMVLELEAYQAEVYDLRHWLAKTINVHPGEILMTALESSPIVVTFMMREKHAKAFSEFLQTDDGQIAVSRKRVEKIVQNGKLIKIGRALNGSNFVHVRLRFQDSVPRQILRRGKQMVTGAISHILRDTNLRVQGSDVYLRVAPTDPSKCDDEIGESLARKNIRKHWDSLVAELEPLTALNELKSCFNERFVEEINNVNSRKERAKLFLIKCCELPKDKLEEIWTYLEEHFSTTKEDNVDLASTREWIKSNWDDVIDEIDNDFFDTTIQNMKDVPYEVHHSWTDGNKRRTEKAKMFLEFVLTRNDCLKALQKTLNEYGMDCP